LPWLLAFKPLYSASKLPEESKGQLLCSVQVRWNVCNTKQL